MKRKQLLALTIAFAYVLMIGVADAYAQTVAETKGAWARKLLIAMNAPTSNDNIAGVVGWMQQEGSRSSWNPLNTTRMTDGVTGTFNSHGVRHYATEEAGIAATVATIEAYPSFARALRADQFSTVFGMASAWHTWCTCDGAHYGRNLAKFQSQILANFDGRTGEVLPAGGQVPVPVAATATTTAAPPVDAVATMQPSEARAETVPPIPTIDPILAGIIAIAMSVATVMIVKRGAIVPGVLVLASLAGFVLLVASSMIEGTGVVIADAVHDAIVFATQPEHLAFVRNVAAGALAMLVVVLAGAARRGREIVRVVLSTFLPFAHVIRRAIRSAWSVRAWITPPMVWIVAVSTAASLTNPTIIGWCLIAATVGIVALRIFERRTKVVA